MCWGHNLIKGTQKQATKCVVLTAHSLKLLLMLIKLK